MNKSKKKFILIAGIIAIVGIGIWTFYSRHAALDNRCGHPYMRIVQQTNGDAKMKENMFLVPLGFDDMFDWRPNIMSAEFSDPFARMHRHMSRLLAAMDSELTNAGQKLPSRAMRMDAFVKDGKFKVITDMPGLSKDDIEVSVHDGLLSVRGEKESAQKDANSDGDYYLNERSRVSFARTISLPEGVEADKAEVEFKDGVLNISMPVKTLPKPEVKKLTIK